MKNKNFLQRLAVAAGGLKAAFWEEKNFRIQSLVALLVIAAMIAMHLSAIERSILVLAILVVLSLELLNSQIEKFLDIIEPNLHPRVKIIKDFSAGAVLLAASASVIIGCLIFLPHILPLLNINK